MNPEPAGGFWPSALPGIGAAGSPARIELSVADSTSEGVRYPFDRFVP